MRNFKLLIAVLIFVLSATFSVSAQESRQEATPAVQPDMKQDKKQEAAPAAKEATHEGKDHAGMKEKRYIATVGPDGVQHVDILGGEYFFDPNHIVVKVNIPVELKVKKEKGFAPHDLVVKAPEAGIDFKADLSDKDTKIVKFTPTKAGKYQMFCDKQLLFFTSHRERGMEGVIEVVQ